MIILSTKVKSLLKRLPHLTIPKLKLRKSLDILEPQLFRKRKIRNEKFLRNDKKIIESPENFRVTKTQCPLLKKYFKKEFINIKTGEIVDSTNLIALLDMDKIKTEYELLGYYTIITSETNMPNPLLSAIYLDCMVIWHCFFC